MRPVQVTLRRIAVLVWVVLAAGCAMLGGPRTFTLDEAEIARLIERQFPYDKRLLEVLDVRVAAPRVRLLPVTNRVATEADVNVNDRLFGRKLDGRLALEYGLRYDEQDQSVKLADVRVNQLVFDQVPPPMQPLVNRLAPLLAEQLLNGLALHRFKPDDLKGVYGQGLKPGAVTVTARGIEVSLGETK